MAHLLDAHRPQTAVAPAPGGTRSHPVLDLQRAAGNAAVAQAVALQRRVEIDEVETSPGAETAPTGGPSQDAGAPAGAAQGGGGATALGSPGGATEVQGSSIRLNAPMVTAPGVLQVDTIVAQNVVGASYTPGAGNVW